MIGIQILGVLFGLFMLYYTFLSFKRKEFRKGEFIAWIFLWILFVIVTVFPGLLDPIVASLSISRTMDFFIIIGFMFLIGLGFYSYRITRKNQKKIENIVREIAIKREK